MAAAHPEIVCAIHLGLMRGVLEAAGETGVAVSLEPFVEPTLCTVAVGETHDV